MLKLFIWMDDKFISFISFDEPALTEHYPKGVLDLCESLAPAQDNHRHV